MRASVADKLILPGVGAFGDGIANLRKLGLDKVLDAYVREGKELLGICLGMQLFMDSSEEFGYHEGLHLIQGKVVRFPESAQLSYTIPHIGWSALELPQKRSTMSWKGTVLESVSPGAFVYFVHSYVIVPKLAECVVAETSYGPRPFCSVVRYENIQGCQFHPEKSGKIGLGIYRTFVFGNTLR